jgi:hypothetical protein
MTTVSFGVAVSAAPGERAGECPCEMRMVDVVAVRPLYCGSGVVAACGVGGGRYVVEVCAAVAEVGCDIVLVALFVCAVLFAVPWAAALLLQLSFDMLVAALFAVRLVVLVAALVGIAWS